MASMPHDGAFDGAVRYSRGAIAFHWTIAALVIANLFIGLFHESLLDGLRWIMPLHKSIGLTVLVLTLGRIGWRLAHRPPPLPADMAGWEKTAAHGVHWALYALMLALPLTGWLLVSDPAHLRPLDWFGVVGVPTLPVASATAGAAHAVHGPLGLLMLALIVVHVGAALRHQFILKDRVLGRMLPGA